MPLQPSPLIPAELAAPKTLGDHRRLHTFCVSLLIAEAQRLGTPLAGDAWKTNAAGEGHRPDGCHPLGLALDALLYDDADHDGQRDDYETSTEKYHLLGQFWKSLHPLCSWGGDFHSADGTAKPDGNHFSVTYGGHA